MRHKYIYAPGGKLVAEYKGHDCVYFDSDYYDAMDAGYMVMPDIKPYKSMLDGSEIASRSVHRAHLRQHGCIEIGNDSSLTRKPQPLQSPPRLKDEIIKVATEKLTRL